MKTDALVPKDAGTLAAIMVLAVVLGLMIIIGVILLMMWTQPDIQHSPSQQSTLRTPGALSNPYLTPALLHHPHFTEHFGGVRSEA